MFYKKKDLPEEGELVVCTVKKVLSHSVFVALDEYEDAEGMIYISEISPGRIRNIRDYVKEGKKIVTKVLKVNDKHHIDLSLRRVSTGLKIKKSKEYKQEIKAEKLLELIGKTNKMSIEDMYKEVGYKAIDEYGSLTEFFNEVLKDEKIVKKLDIKDKIAKDLVKNIKEKMKIPEVRISGDLIIKSYDTNGVNIIKKALTESVKEGITISYVTAPKYKITVESKDYKKAEAILKEAVEKINNEVKKGDIEFEFKRNA